MSERKGSGWKRTGRYGGVIGILMFEVHFVGS